MSPIASFAAPSAAGLDDTVFLQILRDDMDDPPIPFGETFITTPPTPWVRLNQYPLFDADSFLSVTQATSGGGQKSYNLVDSRKDIQQGTGASTPDCYVEPETGYVYFLDRPSLSENTALSITHYKVRWTNRRMLNALYAGLKAMFPRVWQRKTFTFPAAVNQWEYSLSNDFLDPRVRILRVEWQEIPFSTERYHPVNGCYLTQLNTLMVPWSQNLTPGANIRITYAAPYYSLSDMEPQIQYLPTWYAKGRLLMDKEILRVRYDLGPVAQNEQSYPPGTSQNAGIYFMQQFERELDRLARPIPHSMARPVYSR